MKNTLLIILLLLAMCTAGFAQAQETPQTESDSFNTPPTERVSKADYERPPTRLEHQLSYVVLLFGFLILALEVYLIKVKDIDPQDAIKFVVVTLIVIGTLFLISAGWSNDQIAPAFGLLGTIAGYLLGRQKTP